MDSPRDIARGLLGPAYQPVSDFAAGLFGILDPRQDLADLREGGAKVAEGVRTGDPVRAAAGVGQNLTGAVGLLGGPFVDAATEASALGAAALRGVKWEDVPDRIKRLFSGRTDEEKQRYLDIAAADAYMTGQAPRTAGPKTGAGWFPGANVKMDMPVEDVVAQRVVQRPVDEATPIPMSWESRLGQIMVPITGDRVDTGLLQSAMGVDFKDNPVDLGGGPTYMRNPEGAWASEEKAMAAVANRIPELDGDVFLSYMPMAGTGSDFAKATYQTVSRVWSPDQLTKAGKELVTQRMRTGTGIDGKFPDAPMVGTKEFEDRVASSSKFRKAYMQALDNGAVMKEGGPDMGKVRASITNPRYLQVPNVESQNLNEQMLGWENVQPHPMGLMAPSTHQTYNTALLKGPQGYLGQADVLLPRGLALRDWTRGKRAAGKSLERDWRAAFTGPISARQVIDQEFVDAAQGYGLLKDYLRED